MPKIALTDKPYRGDILMDELIAAGLTAGSFGIMGIQNTQHVTVTYQSEADLSTIQTVAQSHDASIESIVEEIENNRNTLVDTARQRFITEISSDTPDWADLYSDIATALSNRPAVLNRVLSMTNLIANALGIADLSLVSATQRNSIRLIAAILVLALYR